MQPPSWEPPVAGGAALCARDSSGRWSLALSSPDTRPGQRPDRQHSGLAGSTPGKAPWAPGPRGLCKGGLAAPCSHPEPETPLRSDTWEPPSNLYYHIHRRGRWSRTMARAWQVRSRTQTRPAKSAMPPETYFPTPTSPHRKHQATRWALTCSRTENPHQLPHLLPA